MLAWTKKPDLLVYGALSHIWEKESSMALQVVRRSNMIGQALWCTWLDITSCIK